ncbi:MAG: hypothetical protein IID37_06130 [Planctomycetes bacterium]|nr:hypothetical protein [Planctomycetota bacterium]
MTDKTDGAAIVEMNRTNMKVDPPVPEDSQRQREGSVARRERNTPWWAMVAKILQAQRTPATDPLWWSVVLGSNLTAIGSATTLVAVTIIQKNDLAMLFGRCVKLAIPFASLQIALPPVYTLLALR